LLLLLLFGGHEAIVPFHSMFSLSYHYTDAWQSPKICAVLRLDEVVEMRSPSIII